MNVFDTIYRDNLWNGEESRSGPGSGTYATRHIVPAILDIVKEFGVTSVLDVGCGDNYWMPDLPGYVGCDVSVNALQMARLRHPDRMYVLGLPAQFFDLVIIRDVIQHLPLYAGKGLVSDAVFYSAGRLLLASTYVGGTNVDIAEGESYCPDLEQSPFSLGKPDRLIFDGYHYHDTDEPRDPTKFLGLWT